VGETHEWYACYKWIVRKTIMVVIKLYFPLEISLLLKKKLSSLSLQVTTERRIFVVKSRIKNYTMEEI